MRYFTDGAGHLARVDTDARTTDSDQFVAAESSVFIAKRGVWKTSSSIVDKILYTGDWASCTEAAAADLMGAAPGGPRIAGVRATSPG